MEKQEAARLEQDLFAELDKLYPKKESIYKLN